MARSMRAFGNRRIFDIAEPIFEIRKAVFFRELRSELDHLRRVIDGDYLARGFGEELRERSFSRPEVGHGQGRQAD